MNLTMQVNLTLSQDEAGVLRKFLGNMSEDEAEKIGMTRLDFEMLMKLYDLLDDLLEDDE